MRRIAVATRLRCAALAGALFSIAIGSPAQAVTVLAFGQANNTQFLTAAANGTNTATTLSAVDLPVTITQIAAGPPTPLAAFFNFNATSTSVVTPIGGNLSQPFSGTFSITSLAGGSGVNYLSGIFSDVAFGSGSSLALQASTPIESVSFTSAVMGSFVVPLALGLSLTSVSPVLSVCGNTLCSFSANVAGNFSAQAAPPPVPLPAALPLFASGLGALGLFGWRSKKKKAPAQAV